MSDSNQRILEAGIRSYIDHLHTIEAAFNEAASAGDLPVRMSVERAVNAVNSGMGLGRVAPFWSREDDSGVMHIAQLKTAVDCLAMMLNDQRRCGHVVGAMQSGKTTTSLALQFAGPAIYQVTGAKFQPFYLIGNQVNHEDQTRTELASFLAFYGDVEIRRADDGAARDWELDCLFEMAPSLDNYRQHVLRGALEDVFTVPGVEDLVHRKVGGQRCLTRIAELTGRAVDAGFRTLMIIDEPQFGAGDTLVNTPEGVQRRRCVLAQIFDKIEDRLGLAATDHHIVGLSATPFELNDLENVWEVRQYLTETYSGFNYFNGQPITPGMRIAAPETLGLTECSEEMDIPFLAVISPTAYSGTDRQFRAHAEKIGYDGDQDEYRVDVQGALRALVMHVITESDGLGGPVGLCIRAFNDNGLTEGLIRDLDLDSDVVEVIPYFGQASSGMSVKRMIARRGRPDLPYVVFVTNRARMADAFPVQVRFFLDLAKKAGDLNALLQGLLGRACGYGKASTVVLSDANARIVDAYAATSGGYVYKPSRHAVPVGGFRRGVPTSMLKFRTDMNDPVVRAFFAEVDRRVVTEFIPPGSGKIPRAQGTHAGYRTAPLLSIAEETGVFEHVEREEVRDVLFPSIRVPFRVARAGDPIRPVSRPDARLRYAFDDRGWCRFTFRWGNSLDERARGGAQGRAVGERDSDTEHMEPTIYVEKYDPATGEVIDDRRPALDEALCPGSWRAFMVTFPAVTPFREIIAATVAYPTPVSVFDPWMTEDERTRRGGDAVNL